MAVLVELWLAFVEAFTNTAREGNPKASRRERIETVFALVFGILLLVLVTGGIGLAGYFYLVGRRWL